MSETPFRFDPHPDRVLEYAEVEDPNGGALLTGGLANVRQTTVTLRVLVSPAEEAALTDAQNWFRSVSYGDHDDWTARVIFDRHFTPLGHRLAAENAALRTGPAHLVDPVVNDMIAAERRSVVVVQLRRVYEYEPA